MSIEEIKASGLIEYYVLGLLSAEEIQQVEGYFSKYPELKQELIEIQVAMQAFAQAKAIIPDPSLESRILDHVNKSGRKSDLSTESNNTGKSNSSSGGMKLFSGLLFIGLLSALWFAIDKNQSYASLQNDFTVLKKECDSVSIENDRKVELFKSVNNPDAEVLKITPTPKYPDTKLLFFLNTQSKQNYIQTQNLPIIAANEAYQLWSLKDGQDPIPLTVFKVGDDVLIPVDFEEGTGTYALTIENEEGALSPNLDRLIGTITI